jgi:hypothetical protein
MTRALVLLVGLTIACKQEVAEPLPACRLETGPLSACEARCRDGELRSCSNLHSLIVEEDQGDAEQLASVRELFAKQCRAGQANRCYPAAELANERVEESARVAANARALELLERGCELGSPRSCWTLAEPDLRDYSREHVARNLERVKRACAFVPRTSEAQRLEDLDWFDVEEGSARAYACGYLPALENAADDMGLGEVDCRKTHRSDVLIASAAELAEFASGGWTCLEANLRIEKLTDAIDLRGLEPLQFIHGTLSIEKNESLESLRGLDGLRIVRGDLRVYDNPRLRSFAGLEHLTRTRDVWMWGNPALESLHGLEALVRIGSRPGNFMAWGQLRIVDNDRLESLAGLDALESIPGGLFVEENASLRSLAGLNALAIVGDAIKVVENPELEDISALHGIVSIPRIDSVVPGGREREQPHVQPVFDDNPKLDDCKVQALLVELGDVIRPWDRLDKVDRRCQ